MEIKINDKNYIFRCKPEEISLDDYLTIVDIINEDQYDTYIDSHTKKEVRRREPRPKAERDYDFILGTYIKVLQRLSNIPIKYTRETEVIDMLLPMIYDVFKSIKDIHTEVEGNLEADLPVIEHKGYKMEFNPLDKWTFYKWVTLEVYTSKGEQELVDGQPVQIVKGDRFILPLIYGEWSNDLNGFKDRFDLFNKELSVLVTYPLYLRALHLINQVKSTHTFIYTSGSSHNTSKSPNMEKHSKDFGWLSTLKEISDKGVFGNYLQTKDAPLIEVLEYLNVSCSYDMAEANDFNLNNNTK